MKALYTIPLKKIDGTPTTLAPYQGQVLLIVNVASRCGFTPQYKALETLYRGYKDKGVQVLGFPCNQFLKQEPGNAKAIQDFTQSCFNLTFPLFEKIDVKGSHQSPLYAYLKAHLHKKPLFFVPWNFTKILISPNGEVLEQFLPTTSMRHIQKKIEQLISD